MKGHLSEQALLDLVEGLGEAADANAHAAACADCAARLREARALVATLREVEVPEPPALFWQAFRRGVERRISEERPRVVWLRRLVPLAALAAVVAAAVTLGPTGPGGGVTVRRIEAPAAGAGWSALPAAEEDEALPVLEAVASAGSEWEEGRGLGAFLAGLTDEETAALAEALGTETGEVKL